MKLQDALKPTGKARLSTWHDEAYVYLKNNKIYLKGTAGYDKPYSSEVIIWDDWEPCHEVKEIKPEEPGETWYFKAKDLKIFTFSNYALGLSTIDQTGAIMDIKGMIHGKNGFTRIEPPVEEAT